MQAVHQQQLQHLQRQSWPSTAAHDTIAMVRPASASQVWTTKACAIPVAKQLHAMAPHPFSCSDVSHARRPDVGLWRLARSARRWLWLLMER